MQNNSGAFGWHAPQTAPAQDVLPVASVLTGQNIGSRALILVHPSRCDGLSRVLIEAMGAGVPIITSDAGGNPHCVRDAGLIFGSGDADALSHRLRELLADGELRERLGQKGRERAQAEYSEQAYVDQFTRMIQATVGGRE